MSDVIFDQITSLYQSQVILNHRIKLSPKLAAAVNVYVSLILVLQDAIKDHEETAKAALTVAIPEYLEGKAELVNLDPNAPSPGVPDLSTPELKAAAVEEAIQKAEEKEDKKKVSKDKEEPQPIVFANAWTQVALEVDVKIIIPHFKVESFKSITFSDR